MNRFFEKYGDKFISPPNTSVPIFSDFMFKGTVEELYQGFKQRLLEDLDEANRSPTDEEIRGLAQAIDDMNSGAG